MTPQPPQLRRAPLVARSGVDGHSRSLALEPLRHRLRAGTGVALLSAALALGGCGFDYGAAADSPRNECTLADDCLSGTCMDGLCVEPSPEALRVFIEVEPQEDAERIVPLRWRFDPELVVGPSTQDLTLPRGVQVVGQVRVGSLLVPADLVFTRIQEIPAGALDAVRTRTYAEPTNVEVNGARFETDFVSVLGGGGVYDVSIQPTTAPFAPDNLLPPTTANRVVPPLLLRNVTLPSDTSRWELGVDIVDYSTPCTANLRVGCTLMGDVVQANDLGVEVFEDGLQVRAVERETGRTVSSLGITEDGHFAVAVGPDTGPYAILVSAGADRPLFPEVLAEVRYADDGALRVEVPAFPTVVYAGMVESADGVPLADAQVQFSASALLDGSSGLEARLTRTVVTGSGAAAGEFELSLVPGEYDVLVTPAGDPTLDPLDDPGLLAQRVTLGAEVREVRGQLFVLPRRATFGAQIWTPAGEALGVDVEASPLRRDAFDGSVARYNRAAQASAGPTGWFSLQLDLGLYDVIARPPADSGYPWVLFPGVNVAIPGSTSTRTVDVGMPVPRSGVVRAHDGTPLPGARVTAYVVLQDSQGQRAVAVARTLSDAQGAYRLLLPSHLEPAR